MSTKICAEIYKDNNINVTANLARD